MILGTVLKIDTREAQINGPETRKLMMIHKALHPRDDIDTLYVSRKEGERKLTTTDDTLDVSIRGFKGFIKKNKERLITAAKTVLTTLGQTEQQEKRANRNRKKNNCMDISSEKLLKSLAKQPGHSYGKEILKEKPNLSNCSQKYRH